MKYLEYKPNLFPNNHNLSEFFYSCKQAMNLLKDTYNLTDQEIELVSFGNNGCYLFFISNENTLFKIKLSSGGINCVDKKMFLDLIDSLPIKNKQRRNYDTTYTSINN